MKIKLVKEEIIHFKIHKIYCNTFNRQIPNYHKKEHKNMTEEEMSKQLQDQINRLQQMRIQYQMIMQQRQQVELRLKEIEDALEELNKTDTKTPIYKSIGALLIKTKGKSEVTKELNSNKESLELRKNTL